MGKSLFSYPVIDDNTSLDSLNFIEKILAIIFQWFRESGREELQESKLANIITEDVLTLQADLISFINKCLFPLKQGNKKSVLIEIDSAFAPVLNNVLKSNYYKDCYFIEVLNWPHIDYNIKYSIIIKITAR